MTHPRHHRISAAIAFFILGAGYASWLARIPAVQMGLNLREGPLGLALLGAGVGALATLPMSGKLIGRYGSRAMTVVSTLGFSLALIPPTLARNAVELFFGLFLLGMATGLMDVAINTQAVEVERLYRRPIMASFHGLFSIGGIVGAASSGLVVSFGIRPMPHLATAAVLFALIAVATAFGLYPGDPRADGKPRAPFFPPPKLLFALAAIVFCSFLGEGAIGDWSGVYLNSVLASGEARATTGYLAFSILMTLGRVMGDGLIGRFGPVRAVFFGSGVAATGIGWALVTDAFPAAVAGFACAGAGFSCVVPAAFSATGRVNGTAPASALAFVTTAGYVGLLVGPAVVGLLSEYLTLRGGLAFVAVLTVLVGVLSPAVGGKSGR